MLELFTSYPNNIIHLKGSWLERVLQVEVFEFLLIPKLNFDHHITITGDKALKDLFYRVQL